MRSPISKRLIAFLALASFTRANYYIDDQNYTSLVYSQNTGGNNWEAFQEGGATLSFHFHNGTTMTVDASHCYNHTFTYAPCRITDDCRVQIPFNGSGITIYVLQAGFVGTNASLTIDGGSPMYNVLPAPSRPYFYTPNVTLFMVQGMTTGNHTATMTVLDWGTTYSGMMFDYALINQTVVSPTTTSTSSAVSSIAAPTMSTVTTSSSNSSTNVGAIIGGVVGSLATLVVLLLAIFYLHRCRRKDVQSMDPFVSNELLHPCTSQRCTGIAEHRTSESLATSLSSSRLQKSQQGTTNQRMTQVIGPSALSPIRAGSPSPSEAPLPRMPQVHPLLTDDQADLVTRLHANDVLAGAIARVIERMMAGEQQPVVDGFDSLPPPSYYHGTGNE